MFSTFGLLEPNFDLQNVYFDCVITLYFVSFFYDHPVYTCPYEYFQKFLTLLCTRCHGMHHNTVSSAELSHHKHQLATKNVVRKQSLMTVVYWCTIDRDNLQGSKECHNDQSSLSDGLQSTQCMTISYNNWCRWWKFYSNRCMYIVEILFSSKNISITRDHIVLLSSVRVDEGVNIN